MCVPALESAAGFAKIAIEWKIFSQETLLHFFGTANSRLRSARNTDIYDGVGVCVCVCQDIVMNRAIFLETVAGVPGMAGGMMRHLSSLRNMKRDHGWYVCVYVMCFKQSLYLSLYLSLARSVSLST